MIIGHQSVGNMEMYCEMSTALEGLAVYVASSVVTQEQLNVSRSKEIIECCTISKNAVYVCLSRFCFLCLYQQHAGANVFPQLFTVRYRGHMSYLGRVVSAVTRMRLDEHTPLSYALVRKKRSNTKDHGGMKDTQQFHMFEKKLT